MGSQDLPSRAAALPLVGGTLMFDLANTASGRGGPRAQDHLRHADHVVAWAQHAGIVGAAGARALRRRIARPRVAADLLRRARELRELLHAVGTALAAGAAPRPTLLARLTDIHAGALAHARLTPAGTGFAWCWDAARAPVEAVVGPVALSAIDVVSHAPRARIKQCGGEHCGWLFLDTSKSSRRQWCEMEVCGNRAKQKRLRERRQRSA
jgi:predicted RNA-binding Zn ribbon-like protein